MLKALKNASKRARTRLLVAALAAFAALAAAISIYAATDTGSRTTSKQAVVAKGGVKGLHERRLPRGGGKSGNHESARGSKAGTTFAATPPGTGAGAGATTPGGGTGTKAPGGNTGTKAPGGGGAKTPGGGGTTSDPKGGSPGAGNTGKAGHSPGLNFSIGGRPAGPLSPGGAPSAIALTLTNPNSVAIHVTALRTTVSGGAPGCGVSQNLRVTQAAVSSSHPVLVPARATVTLPTQGVSEPTIQMLNLPVDQDACASATFKLQYSGKAES